MKLKLYKHISPRLIMKTEDHLRNINESLEVIKESIQKGLQERQRNIGFNVSVAATEMLEVFLHKNSLINPGTTLKHELFASLKRAKEKLNFDFEQFRNAEFAEEEKDPLEEGFKKMWEAMLIFKKVHDKSRSTKLRLLIEQYTALAQTFKEVLGRS